MDCACACACVCMCVCVCVYEYICKEAFRCIEFVVFACHVCVEASIFDSLMNC